MVTTIKGIYDHGRIILAEQPPLKTKAEVIVTFLSEETKALPTKKRLFGGLEGKLKLPDDFNEPLDEMNG
jgi:hypothetical protein